MSKPDRLKPGVDQAFLQKAVNTYARLWEQRGIIVAMLSKDFARLVLVASLIAFLVGS